MCLTCGTECVIDATLDQRRKLSTKRLAEQADGQRELLSSLFQTLQHSAPEDLQNLVHSIRSGASAEQVAACIRTNVKSLQDQEIPSSSNVDDLLDSFGALLRDRDSNSSGQSVSSSPSKRSLSVSTHMTSQFPPIYSPSNQYEHSALSPNPDSPRVALHQTHQRWDRYVQTQHAQLDTIGLDNLDGFDRIGINSADLNGTLQTPPLGDQMPLGSTEEDTADGQHSSPFSTPFNSASAADERFFWHPVLRVIPTPSGPSPLAPNMSIHTATDSRHRSTTSLDERYVEIIQPFPSSLTDLKNDAALDKTPSHLNSTKYPIHTIQPRYKSENSPLARHIIDFRDAARRFIAEGNPLSEVLGRDDGVAVDLFLRDRTENDGFTVSNWACEVSPAFSFPYHHHAASLPLPIHSPLSLFPLSPNSQQPRYQIDLLPPLRTRPLRPPRPDLIHRAPNALAHPAHPAKLLRDPRHAPAPPIPTPRPPPPGRRLPPSPRPARRPRQESARLDHHLCRPWRVDRGLERRDRRRRRR